MKSYKKRLIKSRKKAIKKFAFFSGHPFVVPTVLFFAMVFFGLGMFVAVGGDTVGARDTRIIDVYVDGQHQTVSTRADTVADLLTRLEIQTIPEDIIEPAVDTMLIEDNTQVNVYRARPVIVVDNGRKISVLSAHRSARLLVDEAGIETSPEDDIRLVPREGSILDLSPGEQVVIKRAVPIQLNAFGVITQAKTTAATVGEFLESVDISLGEGETVQPADLTTVISENMFISVNLFGIKTEAINEIVPFGTEYITDSNLDVGKQEVRTKGVDGLKSVIYQIVETDGVETSREVLQTISLANPVTEVVARGSKMLTLSASVSVSAEKAELMAAAGIAASDFGYVDHIISNESGWRPGALNSSSGAYGLCQSLPASKMASAGADYMTNPVTQLRWCNGYASRYGGWAGAYNAWVVQHWW